MNLILLEPAEVSDDGVATVDGRRAEHMHDILSVSPGDTVRVGIVGVGVGQGRVVSMTKGSATLDVTITHPPEPPPAIDLIVALPRPQTLKKVLSQAATMGVGRVDLIRARRVEKSYFQSPLLSEESLRAQLLLGMEQGRVVRMPKVEIHPRFMPFAQDVLPQRLGLESGADTVGVVAAVEARGDLWSVPLKRDGSQRVLIAIGPEGGWTEHEVKTLGEAGLRSISMGRRVLRVETAAVALMAQISLLLSRPHHR